MSENLWQPNKAPKKKPDEEQGEEDGKIGRRAMLAGLVGLAGITVAGTARIMTMRDPAREDEPAPPPTPPATHPEVAPQVAEAPVEARELPQGPFDTGRLAGRHLGDLFARYLGIPPGSIVPRQLMANFRQILADLWKTKRDVVTRRRSGWIQNTRRAEEVFLEGYRENQEHGDAGPESLAAMNQLFGRIVQGVHSAGEVEVKGIHDVVDFDRLDTLPPFHRLTTEDKNLVKTLAGNISSEMLIAYGITELMPAMNDPELNVDVTEFLVKNAGASFLASIPAMNDEYLSVGFYQFTSKAVYAGPDGKKGASLINDLVTDPAHRIPDSVIGLVTVELQVRAAYLFAVENLCRLIVDIRADRNHARVEHRLATLRAHAPSLRAGTLQYIASAHHNPSQARRGFIKWLDHNFEGTHSQYCGNRIKGYIRKTKGIYDELIARLGS